jgi:hypothetical protein
VDGSGAHFGDGATELADGLEVSEKERQESG